MSDIGASPEVKNEAGCRPEAVGSGVRLTPRECAASIIAADGRWSRDDAEMLARAYLKGSTTSYAAKANVDDWTTPNGGLVYENSDERVLYDAGTSDAYLCGSFEWDTLMEIAMHMRSQQK